MDPVTAGSEVYKVGGIAAVLLLILVYGGWLMFRFFVTLVNRLGERLDAVQGAQVNELKEVVKANTTAFVELRNTDTQILEALRVRPCLIETGQHRVIKTPLPQKHHL